MKKLILLIGLLVIILSILIAISLRIIKSTDSLFKSDVWMSTAMKQDVLINAELIEVTDLLELESQEKALEEIELSQEITTLKELDTSEEIDVEKKNTITLTAAGDCTLGYSHKQSIWNRFDTIVKAKGYDYFFENVKGIFGQDDLTIVNLEGPLTRETTFMDKEFAFKGDPEYVQILTSGGVDVVNIANNHTRDYGEAGYIETQKVLKEANINFFGEDTIFYDTINGIRVGIIGQKGWSSDQWVKNNLTRLITSAKEQSDLVIVMFHWGVENTYYPIQAQKDLGRQAIDEGAHLVLGSHPHVIQGIESYKGRNIVYSLGNFCFGGNRNPADKDTFIYQVTFELTDRGIVEVHSEIIACSISSVKDHNDYRPTPLAGEEKRLFEERMKTYSSFK